MHSNNLQDRWLVAMWLTVCVLLFYAAKTHAEPQIPKQVFRYAGVVEVKMNGGKDRWARFEPMYPIAFGVQAVSSGISLEQGETLICEPFAHSQDVTLADGKPAVATTVRLRCEGGRIFEVKGPIFER